MSCPTLESLRLSDKVVSGDREFDRCVASRYECKPRFKHAADFKCEGLVWEEGSPYCKVGWREVRSFCVKYTIRDPDWYRCSDGYTLNASTRMCSNPQDHRETVPATAICREGNLNNGKCELEINREIVSFRCPPESAGQDDSTYLCSFKRKVEQEFKCYHGYVTVSTRDGVPYNRQCWFIAHVEVIKKCPPGSSKDPISNLCHEILDAEESCVDGYRLEPMIG